MVDLGCQNMPRKPNNGQTPKLSNRYNFIKLKQVNVTGRPLVQINMEACRRLALSLKSKAIPVAKEDTDLQDFSPEQVGNFYFCLVAICHQTSPRGKPTLEGTVNGDYKRGWDYLSAKLQAGARNNPKLLTPSKWARLTDEEFSELFRDPELGDRLTEPSRRSALVRNLGQVMLSNGWGWIEELYRLSEARIVLGQPNLINLLAQFMAYRDPVRKKSYFFLSLMRNMGLWHYIDEEQLGPPVDYHEVRGHLRLGTVTINDESLRQKLLNSLPVTLAEDIAIRQAVHNAIMLLSELTELHNPIQLHYLFWNVFRSCCSRESPHCHKCPPACQLPERYMHLAIHSDGQRRCPFSAMCAGACDSLHAGYCEHIINTDYY
jgi:hypothetical protein